MRTAIRRYGPSRDVLLLRTVAPATTCLVAAAIIASRPLAAVAVLAAGAALASVAAAVAPRWPWATVTLGLLAAAYALATQSTGMTVKIPASVAMAAALWTLHLLHSLAAGIPRRASISPAALRSWRRRLLTVLSAALPVTALTGLAGAGSPSWLWLKTLGLIAAGGIAAVPGLLALRSARGAAERTGS